MQVINLATESAQMMNIRKISIDLYHINLDVREAVIDRFYQTDYNNGDYIDSNNQPEKGSISIREIFKYMDNISDDKLVPNWLNFMIDLFSVGFLPKIYETQENDFINQIFPNLGSQLNFNKFRELFIIRNKNDDYTEICMDQLKLFARHYNLPDVVDLNELYIIKNMDLKSTKLTYDLMINTVNMVERYIMEDFDLNISSIRNAITKDFPKSISDRIFIFNTTDVDKPWLSLNLNEIDSISESAVFYVLIIDAIRGAFPDIDIYDYKNDFDNLIDYNLN